MPEYIRVRQRETGHELSIIASAYTETAYERVDKPATSADGEPLPPKYHKPLSSLSSLPSPKSSTPEETTGRKATHKEGA